MLTAGADGRQRPPWDNWAIHGPSSHSFWPYVMLTAGADRQRSPWGNWAIHGLSTLILALRDADRRGRWEAAAALGQLGDPRAVEPLILALRDADGRGRREVARALGQLGDPRAVEPLILALRDADDWVRWEVARDLGQLGDVAVEPLILALRDADGGVRQGVPVPWGSWAIHGLSSHSSWPYVMLTVGSYRGQRPPWGNWAIHGLSSHHLGPCMMLTVGSDGAARALGQLGDPRAVEPLILPYVMLDGGVRWEAAAALRQLGRSTGCRATILALRDADCRGRLEPEHLNAQYALIPPAPSSPGAGGAYPVYGVSPERRQARDVVHAAGLRHLPEALAAVQSDSRTRLGPQVGNAGPGRSQATQTIVRGAEMVIVPELPGCRFNPPRTSFCGWRTGTAPSSACRHHQTSPVLRWSRLSWARRLLCWTSPRPRCPSGRTCKRRPTHQL